MPLCLLVFGLLLFNFEEEKKPKELEFVYTIFLLSKHSKNKYCPYKCVIHCQI